MKCSRVAASAIGLVLLVSACSKAPEGSEWTTEYNSDDPGTWPMSELVDHYLDVAIADGASPEQILVLEEASETGEVTLAAVRSATEDARLCMADAGIQVGELEEYDSLGKITFGHSVTYPAGSDERQLQLLESQCRVHHVHHVESVYQYQPAARQALTRALEQHSPALRECLKDDGGTGIDELTTQELWGALKDQSFAPQDTGYLGRTDCLIDTGINW